MAKISQYSTDVNITGNDKWIGSDAQNFLITKNFTPNNLASFFNENNVIDIGASIRYRYQTLLPGEAREQGTISFETEIGPQVNFSDITTFLIAKNTLKGNTVTQYLDFLVDSKVLLSKASNINIFGYYKITSIEPWIPNTNFFVVEVDFLAGNGFIYEDLDYLVSLVDKVQDIPPPVWGSITGDIEDQTDLIDYIASQITTPTLQEILDFDHSLVDGNFFVGTNAGIGNSGDYVNALGEYAAELNSGNYVNSIGWIAGALNTGDNNNFLGTNSGGANIGSSVNAMGAYSVQGNTASSVNAFGYSAGNGNTFEYVNLFGENAIADEDGQTVLSKDGTIMARISTANLTDTRKYNLPDVSGTIALTSDITTPTLQEVMETGRSYNQTIGDYTYRLEFDGGDGAYFSVTDSDLNTFTGVQLQQDALINFVDNTANKGSSVYASVGGAGLITSDSTFGQNTLNVPFKTSGSGSAVFLPPNNKPAGTYTLAITDDITTPTLDQVLTEGNTSNTEIVIGTDFDNGLSLNQAYSNLKETSPSYVKQTGFGYDNFYSLYDDLSTGVAYGAILSPTEGLSLQTFGSGGYAKLKSDLLTTVERTIQFPDASGTIALLSDIPTTSGIPHATASGTDTYTATVPDVIAYNDADAYLIRFTNGNTTSATLNINSLGAIPLYRNNDGVLIGGDIISGGEMLCVYNSTTNRFQVIGTAPNSLLSYVTNDDSVTLTKGMPVYAFGGTGDRMTVKRANNTGDATSAQTVGLVLSTSIGVNQKGLIMMQGLLDGLSILPTSTWNDGDAVYLGATPGTITNVKPYAPNHLVYLGVVTTASNGAAGRMYVRVQNGYELQELHNVDALNPNNNDGIFYNSSTQLWEHKNVLAVAAERRNANNSTNNNINYCGIAPADSLENASVWTITRLTITLAGAVTTANAINVKWTDRETTIYT